MSLRYEQTLVPESPWKRLTPTTRNNLVSITWLLTWGCLLLGYLDPFYWKVVIGISAAQALSLLSLVRFRPLVFPAQLRIAYLCWVSLGTLVPALEPMMHITAVGLGALLAFGYCPLARMLYLLPWNRTHGLSAQAALQTMLQPPRPGRFALSTPEADMRTAV